MLKITSLVSTLIFLLFIGTGSFAHTLVKKDRQQTASSNDKKEKEEDSSEKGEFGDEPRETVHRLDLFQAFSLVNAQLRWKDFHSENQKAALRYVSKKQNVEQQESTDVTELFDAQVVAAEVPSTENHLYVSLVGGRKQLFLHSHVD